MRICAVSELLVDLVIEDDFLDFPSEPRAVGICVIVLVIALVVAIVAVSGRTARITLTK